MLSKEKIKIYNALYYQKNKGKLLPKHKAWSEANKKPAHPRKPRTRKPIPIEKLCPHCGIIKSINDFRPRTGGFFAWICKPCESKYRAAKAKLNRVRENERQRIWVSAHREIVNQRQREKYQRNKAKTKTL